MILTVDQRASLSDSTSLIDFADTVLEVLVEDSLPSVAILVGVVAGASQAPVIQVASDLDHVASVIDNRLLTWGQEAAILELIDIGLKHCSNVVLNILRLQRVCAHTGVGRRLNGWLLLFLWLFDFFLCGSFELHTALEDTVIIGWLGHPDFEVVLGFHSVLLALVSVFNDKVSRLDFEAICRVSEKRFQIGSEQLSRFVTVSDFELVFFASLRLCRGWCRYLLWLVSSIDFCESSLVRHYDFIQKI